MQLHTDFEIRAFAAVLQAPHIPGCDTFHAAVIVIQHLSGGEPRKHLDFECFRLLGQPATHIAEARDVVTLVVHLRRRNKRECPFLCHEQEAIPLDRRIQRRTIGLPVG